MIIDEIIDIIISEQGIDSVSDSELANIWNWEVKEGMNGNFFLGNGQFEMREMRFDEPKDNQVLIRNMAAGICGTDVHIMHGEKGSADVTPPVVLGHEYAGEVIAVGKNVTTCRVGDHVTVDPNIYCGKCGYCRIGKKQLCEHLVAIGVNYNGGFAQYSMVPDSQVFRLSDDLPWEVGAMTEPLACCLRGIRRARITPGDLAVIVGGGTIGLMMMQLALLSGASRVIVSEPSETRRKLAMQLGAFAALNPADGQLDGQIAGITNRRGADVVIECAGNVRATQSAFEAADHGANIVLFSVPQTDAVYPLKLFDVYSKEWNISGSFINPDTHLEAADLLSAGRIQILPLITHRYPLAQLRDAIEKQTMPDSVKVMVLPQE